MEIFSLCLVDDYATIDEVRIERLESLLTTLEVVIFREEVNSYGDVKFVCGTNNYEKVEPLLGVLSDTEKYYYIKED